MKKWTHRKWIYWETSEYHNFSFVFSWELWQWLKIAQPVDCKEKNNYIGGGWTDKELKRYMRYWSRLIFFKRKLKIEFKDFTK